METEPTKEQVEQKIHWYKSDIEFYTKKLESEQGGRTEYRGKIRFAKMMLSQYEFQLKQLNNKHNG